MFRGFIGFVVSMVSWFHVFRGFIGVVVSMVSWYQVSWCQWLHGFIGFVVSCNSSYIGKTNRTLFVRTQEHALTDKESAIYKHLRDCDNIKHIQDLYNLPAIFTNENISSTTVINKEFFAQTVRDNTNIIDRDDNWNLLLYKEAYHIKRLTPFLNNGLKASRELRLFS